MDKCRKRGLRRAINKHHVRAYQRDHQQITRNEIIYCHMWVDHVRSTMKCCKSCRKVKYFRHSNGPSLDVEMQEWNMEAWCPVE
jgi:hypothetical protein